MPPVSLILLPTVRALNRTSMLIDAAVDGQGIAPATLDLAHNQMDRHNGRHRFSLLVLWSAGGALDDWYAEAGGPPAFWRDWADDVHGVPLPGGHFSRKRSQTRPSRL